MAFRFLLVGAVAALGFDLPQGIDVDAWAQSGRAWWHARVAEFEARHGIVLVGAEEDSPSRPKPDPELLAQDEDAAFATVIEDVVSAFAADGQLEGDRGPESSPQLVAGFADAAYGPDFADALNRWADGLSEPEDPATLVVEAGAVVPVMDWGWERDLPVASIAGVAGSAFETSSDRVDDRPGQASDAGIPAEELHALGPIDSPIAEGPGLAEAVRLTGQALQAWLSLIQPGHPDGGHSWPTAD